MAFASKPKGSIRSAISRTIGLLTPGRSSSTKAKSNIEIVETSEETQRDLSETILLYSEVKKSFPRLPAELRQEQVEAVNALLKGKNAMVLLKTGFGKSLIIYLPGLIRSHVKSNRQLTLIVSPLVALIEDSLTKLGSYGLAGIQIKRDEEEDLIKFIGSKNDPISKYMFVSPEVLKIKNIKRLLLECDPFFMAIDEGHLISEWGRDFRKDYASLFEYSVSTGCQVGVFTATLPKEIMLEVKENSGLTDDNLFLLSKSPDRGNIFLDLRKPIMNFDELDFITEEIKEKKGSCPKTLICVVAAKTATDLFFYFQENLDELGVHRDFTGKVLGYVVDMYTGSTENSAKSHILTEFQKPLGYLRVLIATVAFGLGIDIPNIRKAVIFGLPRTKMLLVQELGRAGRDGLQSQGIISPFKARLPRGEQRKYEIPCNRCIRSYLLEDYVVSSGEMIDIESRCISCEKCGCCSICAATCNCSIIKT